MVLRSMSSTTIGLMIDRQSSSESRAAPRGSSEPANRMLPSRSRAVSQPEKKPRDRHGVERTLRLSARLLGGPQWG